MKQIVSTSFHFIILFGQNKEHPTFLIGRDTRRSGTMLADILAAGIASALSIDGKVKVQNIDLPRLQDKLVDQKATLMYFKDVDYTSPHFRMVQYLGLRGYLPEWNARLQDPVDAATLAAWEKLGGTDLPGIEAGKATRLAALQMIYQKIKK